jgi:mannosyltransferase
MLLFLRPSRNALASLYRAVCLHWKLIAVIALLMLLEVCLHIQSYSITRPSTPLDAPFHTGCQTPVLNTTARENAVLVMLARNSEVSGAVSSVRNVQEQFNDNFGYPWVFLNNEEWSNEFKEKVGKAVGAADVKFEVISKEMWGYPEWIDTEKAKQSMQDMKDRGIQYGGMGSYHHMCRFQSGYVLCTPSQGVFFANKSSSE